MPDEPEVEERSVEREGRIQFSEDWAATVVGLVLIVLVLAGVIPTGLVP